MTPKGKKKVAQASLPESEMFRGIKSTTEITERHGIVSDWIKRVFDWPWMKSQFRRSVRGFVGKMV